MRFRPSSDSLVVEKRKGEEGGGGTGAGKLREGREAEAQMREAECCDIINVRVVPA